MIKTNIDILKDTKASTPHMTTNVTQVTDINPEAWNWNNLSLCLWSKQNRQTRALHRSLDILTSSGHKNKSASPKRILLNERSLEFGHFLLCVWWTVLKKKDRDLRE